MGRQVVCCGKSYILKVSPNVPDAELPEHCLPTSQQARLHVEGRGMPNNEHRHDRGNP